MKKGDTQNLDLIDNVYLPFKEWGCLIQEPAIAFGVFSFYSSLYA